MPVLGEVQLPVISGDMLYEVVKKEEVITGVLDGWGWKDLKVFFLSWFEGLADILRLVDEDGRWLEGLLDACFSMIPRVDGAVTPFLAEAFMCLPVVHRLWNSVRMGHIEDS